MGALGIAETNVFAPLLAAACLLVPALSCAQERTDRGVVVDVGRPRADGARKVRVEAWGDAIMRVTATPDADFPAAGSLAVIPQAAPTPFTVGERGDTVTLATRSLVALVSKATGEVSFRDPSGRAILEEDAESRTFEPIEVDGTRAYTVRQAFRSIHDGERLYGLGQHQADEFDYKGKSEELFQYNTKVSVPFVVSSENYGLLWDSYSLLRFGDPRPYAQLDEAFTMYDMDGNEGGLTGTYIPRDGGETLTRLERNIPFEFLDEQTGFTKVVGLPRDFRLNGSRVTYEGFLEPRESGTFNFILYYAGYARVLVGGEEAVPERWRAPWNPNSHKFHIDMRAGERVPLRIEWRPDGDVSYCSLKVHTPLPWDEMRRMSWWGEMQDCLDYYLVLGDSMDGVVSGYRALTGKAPVMPKWAMGFWQSRERYRTQDEVLSTLGDFRARGIPIDNIVQDWNYWREDDWGSHEFDPERFPDPKGMVDSIHAMNGHAMISVWPKFYATTEHFREFDRNGWMYRQAITDSLRDWIGPGYIGSFYDAYSEGARELFWRQMEEHLLPLGFDAWWMDASEPNIKDCTDLDYRKKLSGPTALGPSTQYLNAYALVNAEAIHDGQRRAAPGRRVFLLTRSGFAGLQRYSAATWSGDIASRWEDLKAQVPAGLNFSASGIPYWTMDIGGFTVENRYSAAQREFDRTGRESDDLAEWRELNARWFQFGAFCPLYRAHGQYPYREPWNLAPEGHPCHNSIVHYTRLRYALMPYIYSLAGMTHLEDYTIMRPLAMDFPRDGAALDTGDQFMFGPAIMVAPVCERGARRRRVVFPDGTNWYDIDTGRMVAGGQETEVPAPYERIPVYARQGAIIPLGPDIQYAQEADGSELTIFVYAGGDGEFTIYEDDGETYGYEDGAYATIGLRYDDDAGTLEIGETVGSYPGMPGERRLNIVLVTGDDPRPLSYGIRGTEVRYTGEAVKASLR